MGRSIIFGDIHGCHEEWQDLMEKLAVTADDRLISVGDLIFKGPSTAKTLDLAMRLPNLRCILGNHEFYLLKGWKDNHLHTLTGYHAVAYEEMKSKFETYIRFIAAWPFYLEDQDFIVVHAGLRPGIPLHQQAPLDLTHLRTIGEENKPWFEFYEGAKPVVFGHWARRGLTVRSNAIGLDTGCVYGGELSAVVFPSQEIVSVKARKIYSSFTPKPD